MSAQDHREANRKIAQIIARTVEEFPGLRFGQILQGLGVVEIRAKSITGEIELLDDYHVDPGVILARVRRAVAALHEANPEDPRKEEK